MEAFLPTSEPFSFNQVSVIPSGPGNTKYKIQDVLWGGAGEDLPRHNNLTDLTPPNQQCHTVLGPDNWGRQNEETL